MPCPMGKGKSIPWNEILHPVRKTSNPVRGLFPGGDGGLRLLDDLLELLGAYRRADDPGLGDLEPRHPRERVDEHLAEAVDAPVGVRVHAGEAESAAALGTVVRPGHVLRLLLADRLEDV